MAEVMSKEPHERTEEAEVLVEFVSVNNRNVFSHLTQLKSFAQKDSASHPREALITEVDDKGTLQIRGIRCSMAAISLGYRSALNDCLQAQSDLLFNLSVQLDPTEVVDVFPNSSTSFGMVAHKSEAIHSQYESLLLDTVLGDAELRDRFVLEDGSGELHIKREAAAEYLRAYDAFIKSLVVVVHVGGGMPARATELNPYLRLNTSGQFRSIYAAGKRVFFLAGYNKTSAVTGKNKPIARYMDESASVLLLIDHLVVRPFVALLARFAYGDESEAGGHAHSNYHHFFWVVDGKPVTATNIRQWFGLKFAEFSGCALRMSDYRHVSKHFGKKAGCRVELQSGNRERTQEGDEDGEINAMNQQHGHSTATSNRFYAVKDTDHPGIHQDQLDAFEACSKLWHAYLAATLPVVSSCPSKTQAPQARSLPSQLPSVAVVPPSAGDVDYGQLDLPRDVDPGMGQLIRYPLRRDPVRCLQDVMGPGSVYRSPEQHVAANVIVNTDRNGLVILPTGCGKTQLILVAAKAFPGKTIVVVSPMLALKADFIRRAQSAGLTVSGDVSTFNNESLLVLTPEAALSVPGKQVLNRLQAFNALAKIFIDEAHLILTDTIFRGTLCHLPSLGGYNAPVVLLTATCPIKMEKKLVDAFFHWSCNPIVVRQSCNRPNLVYSVVEHHSETLCLPMVKDAFERLGLGEKILVYTTSIDLTIKLARSLEEIGVTTSKYFSSMTADQKVGSMAEWNSPNQSVMVATSAFGVGVDHPGIRHVFLHGACFSLLDFAQMSGRAGRDGASAEVVLIRVRSLESFVERSIPTWMMDNFVAFKEFASRSDTCRRAILSDFLDGQLGDCFSSRSALCDVCANQHDLLAPAPSDLQVQGTVAHQPPLLNVIQPMVQPASVQPMVQPATAQPMVQPATVQPMVQPASVQPKVQPATPQRRFPAAVPATPLPKAQAPVTPRGASQTAAPSPVQPQMQSTGPSPSVQRGATVFGPKRAKVEQPNGAIASLDLPPQPARKVPRQDNPPPQALGSPLVASKVISDQRVFVAKLLEYMKMLTKYCPWCFVKSQCLTQHPVTATCSLASGKCNKCGGPHLWRSCKKEAHMVGRSCQRCCLPNSIGSESTHSMSFLKCPLTMEHLRLYFYDRVEYGYRETDLTAKFQDVPLFFRMFVQYCEQHIQEKK